MSYIGDVYLAKEEEFSDQDLRCLFSSGLCMAIAILPAPSNLVAFYDTRCYFAGGIDSVVSCTIMSLYLASLN